MTKTIQRIAWIGAISMIMGSAAWAQNPAPCTTPVALGALDNVPFPKLDAPYTATITTTHDQAPVDGSVVHGSVTTYQARDSAGREWQKRSLGCQPGPDGMRHPVLQTLVYDPATGTTISWKENDPTKIFHVLHERPRAPRPPVTTDPRKEAAARSDLEKIMGIHIEDLGSKEIAGIMAQGTRTSQTVPVQAGIDKPIQIVREWWIDKDLNLQILSIDDNSKTGRTVTEIVNLKQGEPDPALFITPAGYTAADNNPGR